MGQPGLISGVVVIEADTPDTKAGLQAVLGQPHIITPRGDGHWYFEHPGYPVKTTVRVIPGVDIREDGGFVNVVGTRPDGSYQILNLPTPIPLCHLTDYQSKYGRHQTVVNQQHQPPLKTD